MSPYQVRLTFRDFRESVKGDYPTEAAADLDAQRAIDSAWADSNIIRVSVERTPSPESGEAS